MLCVQVKGYKRPCAVVVGGVSNLYVGDAADFVFTEGAAVNGDVPGYSVIGYRPGATALPVAAVAPTSTVTLSALGTDAVPETLSTATYTVTGVGTDGNTINLVVGGSTSLTGGTVAKTSAETTVTLLAAKIVTAINGGSHGYTAANAAGVITITGPVGSGSAINASVITDVIVGGITGTKTSFAGGVAAVAASSILVLSGTTAISGTVLKTSAETTLALLATKVADSINGLTGTTGYSASTAGAVITVTGPAGVAANGVTLTRTIVGGITSTATAFSGGAAALPGGAYLFEVDSVEDTINFKATQSYADGSSEWAYEIKARAAKLCQALTNFTKKMDAAASCCQLLFVMVMNDGTIFVAGEKYVGSTQLPKWKIRQDGTVLDSGTTFKSFNGGDLSFKGTYLRAPYEFIGGLSALSGFIAP